MYQLLFVLLIGSVFAAEDDDSFSIGLGVLSPSYTQRVGKENVKVVFNQKENGQFSYTIGDPKGSNSYLSFGGASAAAANSNNAAPQQAYQAPSYAAPQQAPSYAAPQQAYQAPSYAAPQQAPTYAAPQQAYQAPSYAAPQQAPSYAAPQQAYQAPSYAAPQQAAREPAGFMPAGFSYHATEGQAYLRQGGELRKPEPSPNQIMPAGFSYHATEGQSFLRQNEARKPSEGQQGLPAGFSYHAMEGQSYLRQGDSPNFMIGSDKQQGRGPAEQSFYTNFQGQQGGQGLPNGLVGYGQGGPRGSLPIGGYAGAQHSGTFKEHGGHE